MQTANLPTITRTGSGTTSKLQPAEGLRFVYLAAHFALDLLEEGEAKVTMDYVEARRAKLAQMTEGG